MEKFLPKGLLAPGGSLFCAASFFHGYIRRAENRLFEADGCLFFAGYFVDLHQYCFLFSDFSAVSETRDALPADFDDAGGNCGGGCVDLYQSSAL